MSVEYSRRQPGAIPFGEDWARFARRQSDERRLAFFDNFLKVADGWIPDEDATAEELDDYDRMERLMSAHLNGKSGGRPSKVKTPSKTPLKTPCETPYQNPIEGRKEGKKESLEGTTTAQVRGKPPPPTIDQFVDGGKLAGVPEDFAQRFYADLVAAGWEDADGHYVANWRRYLKSAYREEQKKIPAARVEVVRSDWQSGGAALDDIPDVR